MRDDGRLVIPIGSDTQGAHLVRDALAAVVDVRSDVKFEIRTFRAVEPSILVAVVGAGGTALGALLAGVFKLLESGASERVVIQGRNGRRIEVPAGCNQAELERYLDAARELDIDRIQL